MISSLLSVTPSFTSSVVNYIDTKIKESSPYLLITTATISTIAVQKLWRYFQPSWGQSRREQIGEFALKIPTIKKTFDQDTNKLRLEFKKKVQQKWLPFEPLITTIPKEGWSLEKLINLIEKYSKITSTALKGKQLSGTIYSKSLDKGHEDIDKNVFKKIDESNYFDALSQKIDQAVNHGFNRSKLWNSLHSDEFAIGACIDYQVVRMVASMFGGEKNEVKGFVTSGGTESLMLAVRAYRNRGIKEKGHKPGEGVIIASKNVHAALIKAGKAYLVNVELVDTDEEGRIDLDALKKAVKKHGNTVIGIMGSAPNYPTGVSDPIEEMAKIAEKNDFGMHVDCCLGGFIIDNLSDKTDYLKIKGVTSLSADTHKNGFATKGSSVLVTKKIGDKNLAHHSIYSIPGWSGGVYGTPKDSGSQSCVQSLNALLSLLGTGQNGYMCAAEMIYTAVKALADIMSEHKGKITLIAKPEVNVVAFTINPKWGLQKGATYAFAHEMAKRGVVLNTLGNDMAHFCVTLRFAGNEKALEQFKTALNESLIAVEKLNEELTKKGEKFSGDAGMYCAIGDAMTPEKKTMSVKKYAENVLLGLQGADEAVKAYFETQLDPYQN